MHIAFWSLELALFPGLNNIQVKGLPTGGMSFSDFLKEDKWHYHVADTLYNQSGHLYLQRQFKVYCCGRFLTFKAQTDK